MQNLIHQIVGDLANGRDKHLIIEELTKKGIEVELAQKTVNKLNKDVQKIRSRQAAGSAGLTLIILGIGGFLLPLIGIDFFVFNWVYQWGVPTGNLIKLSVLALGVLFFLLSDPEF